MALASDRPGIHLRWDMAEGRNFTQLVEVLALGRIQGSTRLSRGDDRSADHRTPYRQPAGTHGHGGPVSFWWPQCQRRPG